MVKLHIEFSDEEIYELYCVLNRALNTLPPDKWPKWCVELVDRLEFKIMKDKNEASLPK
jgi:hypothetical protein